jgi:hypothetical protein
LPVGLEPNMLCVVPVIVTSGVGTGMLSLYLYFR